MTGKQFGGALQMVAAVLIVAFLISGVAHCQTWEVDRVTHPVLRVDSDSRPVGVRAGEARGGSLEHPAPDALPVPAEWEQAYVWFTPLALGSTEASVGKGKEKGRMAGLWSVSVCNLSSSQAAILPRAMVLAVSPSIRWIPDGHREELLNSRQKRSAWNVLATAFREGSPVAASVLGAIYGSPAAGAGSGLLVRSIIERAFSAGQSAAEKNAVAYKLHSPLPLQVVIAPGSCVEHDILSSLVPHASKHGGRVGK